MSRVYRKYWYRCRFACKIQNQWDEIVALGRGKLRTINMMLYSSSQQSAKDDEDLLAPENFAMVEPGVYRSSFPRSKNMGFLKTLRLKSVVALIPEDYPVHMVEFYKQCNVTLIAHGLDGNKWPFKEIDELDFKKVLRDVIDPSNRPLLIHCNKGKHRTGSVVGCLRKLRGWAMSSIAAEYLMMAAPKTRLEDQRYIEAFDVGEFNEYLIAMEDDEQRRRIEAQAAAVAAAEAAEALAT